MLNYQGIADLLKNPKIFKKLDQPVKQVFDMSVIDVHNSGKSFAGHRINTIE